MDQFFNFKPNSPIYSLPMSSTDFQMAQQTAYQQVELQPDVVREELQHRRALEREESKSRHRQLEILQKQAIREKTNKISYCGDSVQLAIISGTKVILAEKTLFRCRILQLKCYQYDNADSYYWQIVLAEQGGNSEVISQLYSADLITSPNKLQGTILSKYICENDNKTDALAWRWMLSQLNTLYEDADIIEIPFKPGWFQTENRWHFWTNSDDFFQISDLIEKFSIEHFDNLHPDEIANNFLYFTTKCAAGQVELSILMIFRFIALLGRFTCAEQPCPSLTIIGKNAKQVAQKYLRTMQNDIDTTNIDSDRICNIRSRVAGLQDTPAIFLSSEPDNKSTQNRMHEIRSWMNTGLVEGEKITVPFVFCIDGFSQQYHLANTVVIDASTFEFSNAPLFYDQLQSLIITIIESSGEYWGNETKRYMLRIKENLRYLRQLIG